MIRHGGTGQAAAKSIIILSLLILCFSGAGSLSCSCDSRSQGKQKVFGLGSSMLIPVFDLYSAAESTAFWYIPGYLLLSQIFTSLAEQESSQLLSLLCLSCIAKRDTTAHILWWVMRNMYSSFFSDLVGVPPPISSCIKAAKHSRRWRRELYSVSWSWR